MIIEKWENGTESGMFHVWFATMYFDYIGLSSYNDQTIVIAIFCGRTLFFVGRLIKYVHIL